MTLEIVCQIIVALILVLSLVANMWLGLLVQELRCTVRSNEETIRRISDYSARKSVLLKEISRKAKDGV